MQTQIHEMSGQGKLFKKNSNNSGNISVETKCWKKKQKKHVVSSYVASFCDSNVIDYNWVLLDESFCDVMK